MQTAVTAAYVEKRPGCHSIGLIDASPRQSHHIYTQHLHFIGHEVLTATKQSIAMLIPHISLTSPQTLTPHLQ